jgi:hypothetical protein
MPSRTASPRAGPARQQDLLIGDKVGKHNYQENGTGNRMFSVQGGLSVVQGGVDALIVALAGRM